MTRDAPARRPRPDPARTADGQTCRVKGSDAVITPFSA